MTEAARSAFAKHLFDGIASNYDLWAEALSYGQYHLWRRALVESVPVAPEAEVLDVATGTAGVAMALARKHGCLVTGIDQSPLMLAAARANLSAAALDGRVTLVEGGAGSLPFANAAFAGLTFSFLWRYVENPAAVLTEMARVVRPGGWMAGLEFAVPPGLLTWTAWVAHTRLLLPAAGRLISPGWAEVGGFLGPSISRLYRRHPLAEQLRWWRAAGIEAVNVRHLSLGGAVIVSGRRGGG